MQEVKLARDLDEDSLTRRELDLIEGLFIMFKLHLLLNASY